MDMDLLLRIAGALVAVLTFTVSFVRWVNGEITKIKEQFDDKVLKAKDSLEKKIADSVDTRTCELIHATTARDVDRIEKALNEGLKAIYEKFDRLNETINKLISKN